MPSARPHEALEERVRRGVDGRQQRDAGVRVQLHRALDALPHALSARESSARQLRTHRMDAARAFIKRSVLQME